MKKKYFLSLGVVCVLIAGYLLGSRMHPFRSGPKTRQPEIDQRAYEQQFARACKLLSANTLAVSEVADAVSKNWIQAIALGLNSTAQVERVFSELEDSGARPTLNQSHKELQDLLQVLKDFPFSFHTAFGVLEETYAVYTELYKLALHPAGSLVIFNKQVKGLQEELAKDFNRLTLYTPKTTAENPETVQERPAPPQRQEEPGRAAEGGSGRIGGQTEEEIQETFGDPVSEEYAQNSGFTRKQYLYRGKDITVYYKNGVVSGWTE